MMSRVVPAMGEVIAASRRASRFKRLDFPAFGGPTIATAMPSRSRSPRCPSARWRSISAAAGRSLRTISVFDLRRQVFVGKVDDGFEMGEELDQPLAPSRGRGPQFAVELAQSLAALRFGLGSDEVGDRLGLGQIELAVEKSAAGELAWLGEPQAERRERLHHRGEHGPAAVQMQFGDVLASHAARRRGTTAPARHRAVRRSPGREPAPPRHGAAAAESRPGRDETARPGFRTARPHDRDRRRARRRRRGENRVGRGRVAPSVLRRQLVGLQHQPIRRGRRS